MFDFEKLIVYKKSLDHVDFTYELIKKFPADEKYTLGDQYKRASVSVSLNIAEGSAGTKKEFNNFLRISKRSLRECLVCTTIAFRRKYITEQEDKLSREQISEMSKMCTGLQKYLTKKSSQIPPASPN
jgi:four helix bundle protein